MGQSCGGPPLARQASPSCTERGATTKCSFDIGVVKHESGLYQLVLIIHFGAVQVMEAFGAEQDASAVFLEYLIFCFARIDLHLYS